MTDKPFDPHAHSWERLRQTADKDKFEAAAYFADLETTPGDGSDFKGHLVHRPGRIETTPGAGEGERWRVEVGHLAVSIGEVVDFPDFYLDGKWVNPFDVAAELNALLAAREGDQQTIADLRAETERWQEFANGYMRDLTAAEQTIAELRKALEEIIAWDDEYAYSIATRALAAIAATEEGKSS